MRFLPFLLTVTAPCAAFAGEQPGSDAGFSVVSGFFQMLASLAVVIGLIYVAYHVANRVLKGGVARKSVPRYIRVVENRFLAPKKSLMLVEVGGEYLLLGSSGDSINLIKQIDMMESIEVVEELSPAVNPGDRLNKWRYSIGGLNPLGEFLRKKNFDFASMRKRMV